MRNLELFSKASLYIESIYYLRLIDKIAPLIDIMSKIFIDMRFFMVILGISIYVFANAYFLIG